MKPISKLSNILITILFTLSLSLQSFQPAKADPTQSVPQDGGVRTGYNQETGKVSFIGADPAKPITVRAAQVHGLAARERAMAMLVPYAAQFGLKDARQELTQKFSRQEGARQVTRYQQTYQGIPVVAGELTVNATAAGGLLSINGEIAPDLNVVTKPAVSAAAAQSTALQSVAKWSQLDPGDLETGQPELWVYDSRLLKSDGQPAALVWRMDVRARDQRMPVDELVLVDAARGGVRLHFSQIDAVAPDGKKEVIDSPAKVRSPEATAPWPVYFELALDEARGWIYGSDSDGNKVDVISMTSLELVKSFTLVSGAAPKGIALSPDGSELAIAQFGAASILFVNPDSGATISTLIPNVDIPSPNKPWDVIYGRAGRLYSSGNPSANGSDYIHVIDTVSHSEVNKSLFSIRSTPYLAISADKNTLFANETFAPNHLYRLNVSTDTIPTPTTTDHTSGFSATTFILDPVDNTIFTDTGQAWSSNLQARIGSTSSVGQMTYLPTHNAVAIAVSSSNAIVFAGAQDFYTLSTYALPSPGTLGPLVGQSDGSKLFVSTSNGIIAVDLSAFPPGTPATLPTGSRPYFDLVLDEAHNVLYGSNTTGQKVDVISMDSLQVIGEVRFNNGARPLGMDLSPGGNELAVALSGASQIAFIDTNTLTISTTTVILNLRTDNSPFDVKYGRTGRLYSSGHLGTGGTEYIHVINTASHTEVNKSSYPMGGSPYLAISADKNTLFANETSFGIYKFDLSTDSPTVSITRSSFSASASYLLLADDSKLFASSGQVWPFSLAAQLGSFSASGYLTEIPGENVVAAFSKITPGLIKFVNTSDYSIISTFTVSGTGTIGPGAATSDTGKLFVNTQNGIMLVDQADPFASINAGTNQIAETQQAFASPLKVLVKGIVGGPVSGLTVTFTAPASGASGEFSDTNSNVTTAVTDVNGIATASLFTANEVAGNYIVTATVAAAPSSLDFHLSNTFVFNGGSRQTYTANATSALPGTLLCDNTTAICTNGANPDADLAHYYAGETYQFYLSHHDRDSLDNAGMPIVSTVDYCDPDPAIPCPYDNAFWSGTQMVYGDGYPVADDVVAHELTHAVTQYESNLFYYYQSGAINESLSDVWGELFDQSNGEGNDTPGVRWQIGEDLAGGALRNMQTPSEFGDPDAITSPNYYTGDLDSGGVHTNSGVNNKAASLLVDGGGPLNGNSVTALGANKTLAIYYEAQTNLLTSGADYADLYNILYQACLNVVGGPDGVVLADCQEVRDATDAVRMNFQPTSDPNFNTDAPLCGAGLAPQDVFYDSMESGLGNWTINNGTYTRWQFDSPYGAYAHSGLHFLFADDYPQTLGSLTDATAQLAAQVIPTNAYLHFAHAYDFERFLGNYYDGGVIEYSTNGGASWIDASPLINSNGYKGTISTDFDNPLQGRSAFVGSSHGYISTRLNLSSLGGQTVKFRWRMGLDDSGYAIGWFVDDVHIYTCSAPTVSGNVGVAGATLNYTGGTTTSAADGSYSFAVPNNWSGTVTPTKACYIFNPLNRSYTNVAANQAAQNYSFTLDPGSGCADVDAVIGGVTRGSYGLPLQGSLRVNYAGLDSGPVRVTSTNAIPIISAIREAWAVNGTTTSFSQLMGLPLGQVSDKYVFPAYNNVTLNDQLRIGNVDTVPSTVTVTIGGVLRGTYTLGPDEAVRVNYAGVDSGPVIVDGTDGVDIISAIREAWAVNGTTTSFVQLMGLPATQLSDKYVFPAYNNVTLNEQLRIGNVDTVPSTVTVTIGGVLRGTYTLQPDEAVRVNYAGLDNGPVIVDGTDGVNIISAIRDAWMVNGVTTSFAQLMGMPATQLSDQYVFPAYNNVTLNEQLRIGNVDTVPSTVTVTIGGVLRGSYTLQPDEAVRVNYAGVDSGPVIVDGTDGVHIISAIREAWASSGVITSFVQLMGLPFGQLSSTYLFPAYNNVTLNEQLRIAVP